ncbi:hypothetical protein EG68_09869 [Paragonimus skrjabini miyazakii]|uniref:RNA-binding protein 10 n=1 Tax=Paragonimus skrjabini miyazakii TaxID=59628 RepID=A0A8S9Y9X4_9TREM|nr:hypothetical protein EG68_09869 [Paragonimus skrjabini miyazakii]
MCILLPALVLRCLDALTTEADICKVFEDTADVKVRQCHVMRDEITHTSRCFAFAELPTVADAYKVMDIVSKEFKLFEIGGKAVTVSYAKNTFNTIMATLKTEGSYNAQLNSSRNLAVDLAHVAMAAQNNNVTPDTVAMNAVAASALLNQGPTSGAAVAHAAIQQKQTEQHVISALAKSMRSTHDHHQPHPVVQSVAGLAAIGQSLPLPSFPFYAASAAVTVFPFPDTSKYIYDESTRFYYDPVTGLLYEPNSKYFYDRASQRYYYWDQTRSSYFPVPQPGTEATANPEPEPNTEQTGNTDAGQTNSDSGERVITMNLFEVSAGDFDLQLLLIPFIRIDVPLLVSKRILVTPQNIVLKFFRVTDFAAPHEVHVSKGKSAQQIAKEMEKWAKRMNAQKKNPIAVAQRSDSSNAENSRTADTGYAMLEAIAAASATNDNRLNTSGNNNSTLVAQYGGPDDSDDSGQGDSVTHKRKGLSDADLEAEGKVAEEEAKLLDWAKLACLLCSRGFKDAATLQKHRSFSSLHIENLNKLRLKNGLHALPVPTSTDSSTTASTSNTANSNMSIASLLQIGAEAANDHAKSVAARQTNIRSTGPSQYRDRAKERRERYGAPSPPRKRVNSPPPTTPPIIPLPPVVPNPALVPPQSAGPNVGSRLMEKMGWQTGQGLGRANQGRTQIIEAEFREAGVGLGIKTSKRGPPSDNYKDNVKRAMFARFHELE